MVGVTFSAAHPTMIRKDSPPAVTNVAAYKFAHLSDLKSLRERLLAQCRAWGLKGTILLSTEGINLFVAGPREEVDQLLAELRAIPGLEKLEPKISVSDRQPFSRMLVRIKKEIIAFGVEGIDPVDHPSPKLPAATLKQWLDEGRPVTLLDTRNDYEVKLGTFAGARTLDIGHFRQFPEAVRQMPNEMKDEPIVMFCTGGIRCEKAGPFMEREGFRRIYQLDGGILKYFEEVGGAHFDGECFVFDQRVGLDPALNETETAQCFACQAPLTPAEQSDPRYVPNESCPHCFDDGSRKMAETIERRHTAIRSATTPLPGSTAVDNFRPIHSPASAAGAPVLEMLCRIFAHIPREEWIERLSDGRVVDDHRQRVAPSRLVREGERFFTVERASMEPDIAVDIRILHEDEAIVVLAKPAPLPVHPAGRFSRNTLQSILNAVYAPQRVRPAHRLDANTTGVLVCARTRFHARVLQEMFESGKVEKTYLARVCGHPADDNFTCMARISQDPGEAGIRRIDSENGLPACTEFTVLERRDDGSSLLEARPLTGRTNQIRAHLWHLGIPICGDPAYLPDGQLGSTQTLARTDSPLCLHAWRIALDHPISGNTTMFTAAPPEWADEPLAKP